MKKVILESPYAGSSKNPVIAFFQRLANRRYARKCVRDSLSRDEAPLASHLLYTQPGILRDHVPTERAWGIEAGLEWRSVAEGSVVYTDRGVSGGMMLGTSAMRAAGKPVVYRKLNCSREWDYSPL
jgi:hypothetical protein